ncbi:hypothetical protein, partial [Salmonella sp. s54925]|uniref:hypothetical protein n=1 Tax=Salmonella sp. s54925 TaxID=3159674 RepID=UPI003981342F
MNTIIVICFSLVVVTTSAAGGPKFCVVKDKVDCAAAMAKGFNVTCVEKLASCATEVANGNADLAVASADDLVANVDKVKIVLAEDYGVTGGFVRYYGVAVVKKGGSLSLKDLKGKKT